MNNSTPDTVTSVESTQPNLIGNTLTANPLVSADKLLNASAFFWFLITLAGQWFFFYYIISFYGYSVITDNMALWNRWEPLGNTPFVAGDTMGNFAFAAHAIGAGIVAFGGALQLMPQLRRGLPRFHKMNGYVYLVTVFALAISGFYLVWIRDEDSLDLNGVGTSINGLLILAFVYLTVKFAIQRDIAKHRKWALRLFLVSNAQWFLRLGVFSYLISGTILGLEPAFGDPFFTLWTFGCFMIPLGTLELYFFGRESRKPAIKYVAAGVLFCMTLLMAAGMVGFTPFLMMVMSGGEITL